MYVYFVYTGSSWRIHMSEVTRDRLEQAGGYEIESRGPIEIKGKGLMNTYWLLGKDDFYKPLPVPPPIGYNRLSSFEKNEFYYIEICFLTLLFFNDRIIWLMKGVSWVSFKKKQH